MSSTATSAQRPLPRRERFLWTLEKFERMIEHGIFGENERVELIEGELYQMSPKGIRHENVRGALQLWLQSWLRRNPRVELVVLSEPGWRPDGKTYCEPDVLIVPPDAKAASANPKDVLLLIEVARSSWEYDTSIKADLYARLGVREYWVLDAKDLRMKVYRKSALRGYGVSDELKAHDTIDATLVPGLTFKPSTLGVD